MIANSTTTLRERLKADTRQQHQDAENRPIERAMAKGELTPEQYVELLGQRWLVHRTLESLLDEAVESQPKLKPFVHDDHKLGPIARADLTRFGVDPDDISPLDATTRTNAWLADVAQTDPVGLLGPHYVFEGSKNGGRFICRSLIKAWGEDYTKRLSYLDPHGDEQPKLWKRFCDALNDLDVDARQQQAIIDTAAGMFESIAAIDDELAPSFNLDHQA